MRQFVAGGKSSQETKNNPIVANKQDVPKNWNPIAEVTPLKSTEAELEPEHLYKTGAHQNNWQRSLRYDPEASPTKNATTSKYEMTEEKERVATPLVPKLNLGGGESKIGHAKQESRDKSSELPALDSLYREISMGSTSFANNQKLQSHSNASSSLNFQSQKNSLEPEVNDSFSHPPARLQEFLKDSISDLRDLFGELIEIARNLEFCKQELVLHSEFNMKDCHVIVSGNHELGQEQFFKFLAEIGIKLSQKQRIYTSLFSDCDLDKDRKLSVSE